MTPSGLLDAFARWSADGSPLVLASVYDTEGSTYSKAGAQMLINADADFQGMLSGGCLEGDLAERSRAVLQSGEPQAVTYDLRQSDEELWGLGVGCEGLIRVFLQPLTAANGYQPFTTIAAALRGDTAQAAAIVIDSDLDDLRPGSSMVLIDSEVRFTDMPAAAAAEIAAVIGATLAEKVSALKQVTTDGKQTRCLCVLLTPPPAILVLGAGLDARPLVRLACELGWRVTVQDHRPAYIDAGRFGEAERVLCVPVEELSATLDLNRYSAAIVMSHHLVSDRSYLRQLAASRVRYIGLLGPIDRRRRLLDELGDIGEQLRERVHGPAGLRLGGRGPAPIALSIIAEMHQLLMADDA